jgi:hypothetical protein
MAECDERFEREREQMRQQFKKDLADALKDLNHQLYVSECKVRKLEVAEMNREKESALMFGKEVVEARSKVSAEVRETRESAYQKVQTLKLEHSEQLKAKDAEISQLKEELKEARIRLCSLGNELKSTKAEKRRAKISSSMQKYHSGLLKYSKHKTCFNWAEEDDEEESSYEGDDEGGGADMSATVATAGQDWEEGDELFVDDSDDESEDLAISENESEHDGGEPAAPDPAAGARRRKGSMKRSAGGSISNRRGAQSFDNNKRAIKRRGKKILCLLHKLSNNGDGRLAIKILGETLEHHKVKGLLYKAGGVEALLGVARASNRYVCNVRMYVCM